MIYYWMGRRDDRDDRNMRGEKLKNRTLLGAAHSSSNEDDG